MVHGGASGANGALRPTNGNIRLLNDHMAALLRNLSQVATKGEPLICRVVRTDVPSAARVETSSDDRAGDPPPGIEEFLNSAPPNWGSPVIDDQKGTLGRRDFIGTAAAASIAICAAAGSAFGQTPPHNNAPHALTAPHNNAPHALTAPHNNAPHALTAPHNNAPHALTAPHNNAPASHDRTRGPHNNAPASHDRTTAPHSNAPATHDRTTAPHSNAPPPQDRSGG